MASRLHRHRRAVVGVTAAAVVLGAGTAAWALTGSSSASYRTAIVTRGTVTQTLTTTGKITPMHSADLDFQVSGAVAKVLVTQGHRVHAGQRVAILDRSSLRSAVDAAQSTLNQARATLLNDEDSQSSAASSSSSPNYSQSTPTQSSSPSPTQSHSQSPTLKTPTPTPSQRSSPVSKPLLAKIHQDQTTLVAAQQQADSDLASAKTALKAETTACADELAGTASNDSSSATADCVAATKVLLVDQQTVATDQDAVAKVAAALTTELSAAVSAATSASHSTATDTVYSSDSSSVVHAVSAVTVTTTAQTAETQTAKSTIASNAASSSDTPIGGTGSTGTVTAATLAKDQSAIDSDRASLASARADLKQATLRTPISGKVAAVTITKGIQASGSATTDDPAVKIVGSNQSKVTVPVTPAQVRQLKVGMTATVTPDGASTPLHATVESIGQAVTDSTTGDTSYPITMTLTSRPTNLVSGADAQVSIVLSRTANVIVVPTSAVHHTDTRTYVQTYATGKLTRRSVMVGATGADVTQVRTGLSIGQRVVLANLNAAVPSSSTNLLDNTGGGLGTTNFRGVGTGGGPTFSGPPGGTATLSR